MNAHTKRLEMLASLEPSDLDAIDALLANMNRTNEATAYARRLVRMTGPPTKSQSMLAKSIRLFVRDRGDLAHMEPGHRPHRMTARALQAAREAGYLTKDNRLTRFGYTCHVEESVRVRQAAHEYIDRRDRNTHPQGEFDQAGRWYPAEHEDCDHSVSPPSRRFPYRYMVHCRTALHVAWLYGVSRRDLMREARRLGT